MPTPETQERVDDLIHDAQHKQGGAAFAAMMGDQTAAKRMFGEAVRLVREAHALDPDHACDAWEEAFSAPDGAAFLRFVTTALAAGAGRGEPPQAAEVAP